MNLTPQQRDVVDAGIGNLLVSAAAGSGKTSVMTERITSRIISGQLDLRRVLVMTFTNAAASNMRAKIEALLIKALENMEDSNQRRRISEQISYLPMTHISTIHSFCLDVISNFGYDARTPEGEPIIEPGFSTLDPTRVTLLFQEAMDEVLSAMYELSYNTQQAQCKDRADAVLPGRNKDGSRAVPFTLLGEDITRGQWFADFDRMAASLGSARSDDSLRSLITSFHSYLRSMPDYEDWTRGKLSEMKAASENFENSKSAQTLLADFADALSLAAPNMYALQQLLPNVNFVKNPAKNKIYQDYYAEQLRIVRELIQARSNAALSWNSCVAFGRQLPEGKGSSASKTDDNINKAEFFRLLSPVREVLYYLTGVCSPQSEIESFKTPARYLFAREKEDLEQELAFMLPVASRLYEVLFLIDDCYANKKRAENGIDFSDYEHLALLLLNKPDARKYYTDTFSEIYIDEYQDNSRIQDAIVSCFSKENCFVVGDVKQSIYRFRHARPQLFLDRMESYRDPQKGTLLELNSNFRSLPGILSLVNDVFSQILSQPSGEIDYDDTQKLVAELKDDPEKKQDPTVELVLVDLTAAAAEPGEGGDSPDTGGFSNTVESPETVDSPDADEFSDTGNTSDSGASKDTGDLRDPSSDGDEADAADLAKTEKEALAVIAKIRGLRESGNVKWSDIAVLTRTNSEVALFCSQLNRYGIPADGGAETEFLSNRELLLMENLMEILDNFRQDIPLAAVMRTTFPQTGFSAGEMLEISLFAKETQYEAEFYHEKVLYYREAGTDPALHQKVKNFCDWIDSLRSRSMYLRVSELIEQIYVETGYREQVSSLPDGSARVLVLETLREWANSYEKGRNGGLYRFVTYIEDIRKKKESPAEFDLAAVDSDVVHCMSIHRSKGLEFRYVFAAGLDRGFPSGDKGTRILMSEKLGIGIDYIRPDDGYWYPTHYKLAMETEEKRAGLAEHMRVFYVAVTRAKEKLFLLGCISRTKDGSIGKSASLMRYARGEESEILPAWLVHKAKSYLDWCLMSLVRNPSLPMNRLLARGEDFERAVPPGIAANRTRDISMSIMPFDELARNLHLSEDEEIKPSAEVPDSEQKCEAILSDEDEKLFALQYSGEYPFEQMTGVPAKMSVSELKRRVNDYQRTEEDDEEISVYPAFAAEGGRPVNLVVKPIDLKTPAVKESLSAAEKGTLLHSIFQYIDFAELSADPSGEGVQRAVLDLVSHKMIRAKFLAQIEPYYSSIAGFASSHLCARMLSAEKEKGRGPFREIPFSITIPVGKSDVSLVQGMIDCWFIENAEAVLIDYKSDTISGTQADKARILSERYSVQLDYYAKAIEAASGLKVKERIIWLIPDGLSFLIGAPGKIL